jgi:uncharacterized SAM-binding protein YcdF (DUF218 family)
MQQPRLRQPAVLQPGLRRLRRAVLLSFALPLLLVALWGGGFLWFLHLATRTAPPPPHSDAILALTGGAGRVETALRLLAAFGADRLLISGVGRPAEFPELAHRAGVPASLAPLVTLGRAALSTRGNAAEAAAWVRDNNVRSLIVVTSYYHMPRALAELRQTLPGVVLHPLPVVPGSSGPASPVGLRLLASEYTKFLAVELGLSRLGGPNEPADAQADADARPDLHPDLRPDPRPESAADLGKTE